MQYASVGKNSISSCPHCDELFIVRGAENAFNQIDALLTAHRAVSPACDQYFLTLPTLADLREELAPQFERADTARQKAISDNPDNGRLGYWLVEGVRHAARTRASSAAEAITKCADEVGDWESPSATFIGEELPDVF